MSDVKLTPQQEIAASATGNSLLVSAAAGSGKTMVLVQRLMRMICNEKSNADITDFLVITYTRAAASELKDRVFRELNRRIAKNPLDKKLRRQSMLCMKANISTIHGFCTKILRENAHLIDLSPDFRVADESESEILKAEVLDRVLDEKYENIQSDADFKAFADLMVETRGDRKLSAAVLDAYDKLRSHPSPDVWMDEQEKQLSFEGISDLSETIWGKEIISHAISTVEYCISKMSDALNEMQDFPDMLKAYGISFETSISGMKRLRSALDIGWDEAISCCDIPFPTARISGYDYFKNIRSNCKDILKKELAVFDGSSADLLEDMKAVSQEARGLYSILRSFDKAYSAEKTKRGIIDFSDQEHLTLKLLYDFENCCPTALAEEVSCRFREVLVDEYQDVNAVQELIFSSVSKNGKNLFMVGDVKQSIYRFRMADPKIFLGKYLSFAEYESEADAPQKVILPTNFRSRKDILDAVNYVFKGLMSTDFGEMDYTEKEFLRAGANYPETHDSSVEYDILDVSESGAEDNVAAEAEFIASKIKELIECGYTIPDGDTVRKAEYSDFAILLRSIKGRAWKYAVALDKLGIDVDIPMSDDYFESYEVSTIMSLLAVIDNPHQDIPLITTLRSPIFRFTLDELAALRAENRRSDLYSAVISSIGTNPKCRFFKEELDTLRVMAAEMPADKFIWTIYNRTGIVELLCASDGGEQRKDNLIMLCELARRFESNGFKGLFRFLNQLRGMMEKGVQPVSSETGGSGVKIMSIHKSKGLEFPVVFLADTTHRFNLQDTTKPVLFHSELGIGLYRKNRQKRYKYPTLSRRAVSRRITLETLSEELRVLYVAMTRAKHRLVMVSTVKDTGKELEKYWSNGEYPASPTRLESIRSYAGWLLTMLLTRAESLNIYEPAERFYNVHEDKPWDIRLIKYTPCKEAVLKETEITEVKADENALERIKRNMNFEYAHLNSETLPSKITATELKGRSLDVETKENAAELYIKKAKLRKPDFTRKDKPLSGSEKGTALHYVLQYIDYSKCHSVSEIETELIRLVEKRFISQRQADAVDPKRIIRFFESPLGKRLSGSDKIEREFKFSILISANEILETKSTDEILLQGVLDCYFEENNEITIIDFKTDRITDDNFSAKTESYSSQIRTYATALSRITGKTVKNAYLYFFDTEKAVEII